jgi:GH25 family lysozyme M1 (1,4-beta-N-acetylmuramidase)
MKFVVPKLQFLDLSHHNWPINWDELKQNTDLIAVGWKASEGDYMTDQYYDTARTEATQRGYLWMAYHFGTNNTVSEQVDRFLSVAKPNFNTRLALDWEDYGEKQMSLSQVQEFLSLVDSKTNRLVTLYSGNTAKEAMGDTHNEFLGKHPLWIPRYSSSANSQPVPQASWAAWDVWQYAADGSGVTPNVAHGVPGHPDCNVFYDNVVAVRQNWSGRTDVPVAGTIYPTPKPPPVVAGVEFQQNAIGNFFKAIANLFRGKSS